MAVSGVELRAAAPATPQGIITYRTYPGDVRAGLAPGGTRPAADGVYYPKRAEGPYPGFPDPDLGVPEDRPVGDVRNNYTMHLEGYFYPPKTGKVQLAIAADDPGWLYMSTNEDPANAVLLATEPGWNPVRAFGANANGRSEVTDGDPSPRIINQSVYINVVANKPYYINAYAVEFGGGDNLAIAMRYEGDAEFADGDVPIAGQYLSSIDRSDTSKAFVARAAINPVQVTATLSNGSGAGAEKVTASSITAKLDGVAVVVTTAVSGENTVVTHAKTDGFFESGSAHKFEVTYRTDKGGPYTESKDVDVAPYITLSAANKADADTTKPGFLWRVSQISPGQGNDNARTERQLAGQIKDGDGVPYPNLADAGALGAATDAKPGTEAWSPIEFTVPGVINFDQAGGSNGNVQPDEQMPGIPGLEGGTDNIAAEVLTYIELTKGLHTFIVNSDDGFEAQTGKSPTDPFRTVLGFFNGGRGAADTPFQFVAPEAGVYPFRFTWEEGGGGANIEILSVKADGTKVLLNDTANGGLKAYRAVRTAPLQVTRISPAPGSARIELNANIEIDVTDGTTQVLDPASVKVKAHGVDVPTTLSKSGKVTKVTANPATDFKPGHTIMVEFTYAATGGAASTSSFSFQARWPAPSELAANSFWIEAEDFNYDGGKTKPEASVMPYAGGAYADLGAVEGIDYNNNDGNDSDVYRQEKDGNGENEVNLNDNLGGRWGKERPGGKEVTVNYKLGWVENGSWQNYTRTIPAGSYKVWAAFSYDGFAPGQLSGSLQEVTAGATTATQTLKNLGSFSANGSGGWGPNDLVALRNADGTDAVITLAGGVTTLRFNLGSGDFDYFILEPAAAPPTEIKISSITLAGNEVTITWTGGGTLVESGTVKGTYTPVAGNPASPAKVQTGGGTKFFQVRQ